MEENGNTMENMESTMQMVKELLPLPGTELGSYTFLEPEDLWTGMVETEGPFVAVAEDNWNVGGMIIIIVMADGPVYIADLVGIDTTKADFRSNLVLREDSLLNYCAADFSKFMKIMKLYMAAVESILDSESEFDEEESEEMERSLRQQFAEIDPTAVEDSDSLWSTLIEELGEGM